MNKILVVIDMQNDFITGCLGNKECEAVVSNVVKVIGKEKYTKIYLTRDTHFENYSETQEGRKLPVIHCVKDSYGWQVNDQVMSAVVSCETEFEFVDKPSFGSTNLGQIISKLADEYSNDVEFVFVGVCTGICVISNVIIAKASAPECKVTVIENACACVTPDTHSTAIAAMKTCQVDVESV